MQGVRRSNPLRALLRHLLGKFFFPQFPKNQLLSLPATFASCCAVIPAGASLSEFSWELSLTDVTMSSSAKKMDSQLLNFSIMQGSSITYVVRLWLRVHLAFHELCSLAPA